MDFTPDSDALLEEARSLLRTQGMAVLATQHPDHGPHTSLMAYAPCGPDTICMVTERKSRKADNLREEPRVSLLVDTRQDSTDRRAVRALTVGGEAELIEDGPELPALRSLVAEHHPHLGDLLESDGLALIRVRATSYLLLRGPSKAVYLQP